MGLNQVDQLLLGHHRLHLRQKLPPFDLLLDGGELVIREAELLVTHSLCPGLLLQVYSPA